MIIKIISIIIMIWFYFIYILKSIKQRKKGIITRQIGKGNKDKKVLQVEHYMSIATYLIIIVELVSIFVMNFKINIVSIIGIIIGIIGNIIFSISVYTMKDSWRAGIPEKVETKLVTNGIYQFSRNPAFLGFDLVYISICILNFNVILLLCSLFAIVTLHLQILQEEKVLIKTFNEPYIKYMNQVNRYIGRKIQ